MIDQEELDLRFTYHSPDERSIAAMKDIRNAARELADLIVEVSKASREQSLAITNLEQCVMWANAGIARHGQ